MNSEEKAAITSASEEIAEILLFLSEKLPEPMRINKGRLSLELADGSLIECYMKLEYETETVIGQIRIKQDRRTIN
jgi:hypothetical protein